MRVASPKDKYRILARQNDELAGVAGEGGEGLGAVGVHGGGGGEQAAGVRVLGRAEELGGGGLLDDAAVLHDGDVVGAVADLADDGEVVGDEEHGEGVGAAEVAQEGEDLGLDGDVEGGGGLVGDEEAGAVDEGHGDEDALALAAGELVRVVAEAGFGVGRATSCMAARTRAADFCARGAGMVGEEGFGDLVADAHDRVEGGHGFLKDHGDVAAAQVTRASDEPR